MKKDFNLTSIDLNKEIKIDENEENKFINFLKEKEVILKSKNFTNLLNINNYLNLREIYNTYKKNLNLNKENFFYHKLLEACKNSFNSFYDLKNYEKEFNDLIKKISNEKEDNNILNHSIMIDVKDTKKIEKRELIKNYIVKLKELENNNLIEFINEEYNKLNEFIDNDNKIRIAFLGTTSTGKSTILNNLIGKKILPTGPGICTKKGIIIQNINDNIPKLYKAKFEEKNEDYYIIKEDKLICEGFEEIEKKLKEINNEKLKFEDIFCILKIKIELFDYLNLDDELKNKIELIDFPGFETNTLNENEVFGPLIDITSGFIFINKDDSIKEYSNETILQKIINFIMFRKDNIQLESSCLFLLNNFSNSNLNINESKKNINQIFKNKIIDNNEFLSFNKNNEQIKVIEIKGRIFENFIKLKNELSDFNKFIKMNINKLTKYKKDEKEKNILKDYIENNYYKNFENRALENQESSKYYNILCDKLKLSSEECFSRKEELYLICKEYEWMSKNIYKHKFFKDSNANELFKSLKIILENIKIIMNQNSENKFKSFLKRFKEVFNIMNRKLNGNLVSKNVEKEKVKNEIISTYKIYLNKIIDEIEEKYIQSNKEIDDYITKIDSDENFAPDKEGKNIVNNIKQNWENLIKKIDEDFNDYNIKLIEIGKEIIEGLENYDINDNIKVNYDYYILINFNNK